MSVLFVDDVRKREKECNTIYLAREQRKYIGIKTNNFAVVISAKFGFQTTGWINKHSVHTSKQYIYFAMNNKTKTYATNCIVSNKPNVSIFHKIFLEKTRKEK